MDRQQKIKLFSEVKKSLLLIIEGTFDSIDEELERYTFKKEDIKLIKAAKARLAIKSVRQDTLNRLKQIGKGYEDL